MMMIMITTVNNNDNNEDICIHITYHIYIAHKGHIPRPATYLEAV